MSDDGEPSTSATSASATARTEVIHGISIDVADGEFIVIVGPSGCGKSTRCAWSPGWRTITAGDDRDRRAASSTTSSREDRDIAMVFQNYALYPHMSVFDNMAFGLQDRGVMPQAEIQTRVERRRRRSSSSTRCSTASRAQLSGGQRQRVAMGRAIVREPALFLFDEPLSNLDAKLRVQMRVEISRLQRRLGDDHALRDARPGGGDDAGRPHAS